MDETSSFCYLKSLQIAQGRNTLGSAMSEICLRTAAIVVAGIAMFVGMAGVFQRLHAKDQGFGPNSLRALGIVIFVPSLVIIGLTFPDFKSETIAAPLGTVAGYILSQATRDQDS